MRSNETAMSGQVPIVPMNVSMIIDIFHTFFAMFHTYIHSTNILTVFLFISLQLYNIPIVLPLLN